MLMNFHCLDCLCVKFNVLSCMLLQILAIVTFKHAVLFRVSDSEEYLEAASPSKYYRDYRLKKGGIRLASKTHSTTN